MHDRVYNKVYCSSKYEVQYQRTFLIFTTNYNTLDLWNKDMFHLNFTSIVYASIVDFVHNVVFSKRNTFFLYSN